MSSQKADAGEKLIASNPARMDFFIEEVVEAGLVLTGTEIKSIRNASPNLRESYVEVRATPSKGLEAWLLNANIGPYQHGNIWNHEPARKRKLLLHKHQIERLYGSIIRDGMSVIPTRMYFKNGLAKVELGVAKGKKKADRRQDIKRKTAEREMQKAMKANRNRS